ncbi:response regulator [Rickettsiales bacterium]|nr:response regulator [Rickettsiales bacterium]
MGKKALVVDDSQTVCNMVAMTLKQEGFDVQTALDGVIAVELASNNEFDFVVTDINMPNMDGIELIRYLREEVPSCKNIPILVLTTEGGDSAKNTGKSVGASGWITKPYRPEVLLAATRKLCNL